MGLQGPDRLLRVRLCSPRRLPALNLGTSLHAPLPSPLQRLSSANLEDRGIALYMKRDDRIDPVISGNKWRKLKYNLIEAERLDQRTLLTFGGAWSNHIHATAAAGARFGFDTIGIIRGERPSEPSAMLRDAESFGMQLEFIDRDSYRRIGSDDFQRELHARFGEHYLIPEGGSNEIALKGVHEIIAEIQMQTRDEDSHGYDIITTACGTATTLSGLIEALPQGKRAIGFSVLRGEDDLTDRVRDTLDLRKVRQGVSWHIETGCHHGGYAKASDELIDFMFRFKEEYGIELDAVYTAKMMYALLAQIEAGHYPGGSRIIALHTGGLQGNRGYPALADL